jgi:hypothetical protein
MFRVSQCTADLAMRGGIGPYTNVPNCLEFSFLRVRPASK